MGTRINQFPKRGLKATNIGSAAFPGSSFLTGLNLQKANDHYPVNCEYNTTRVSSKMGREASGRPFFKISFSMRSVVV